MIRIDLHTHSTFSDGTCTPAEIAALARRKGVSVLALTDHDTVAGLEAFRSACNASRIQGIAGIELSADAPMTVHILGYRLQKLEPLQRALEWIMTARGRRNQKMCERLQGLGLEITLAEVERESVGAVVARPHFASLLVRKGYAKNHQDAFARYLGDEGLAYVAREGYLPEKCIALIRETGGVAVLAHPSQMRLCDEELDHYLAQLKSWGLWGIECVSSHCSAEEALKYFACAERHGLFPTAGSDFHGARRPDACLGVQVGENMLPWARLGVTI